MSRLPHAGHFRDLIVYQKAVILSREIFEITRRFPRDETYSLTDQIRRSSRSIGANIAESWGKRRYEKHFINKLTDADSEQYETQHWIATAQDCNYISEVEAQQLCHKCEEIGRLLHGMMNKSASFCQPDPRLLREGSPEYFTSQDN